MGETNNGYIIIAEELLHSLRRLKGKKRSTIIVKIDDIENAYDTVDWVFLKKVQGGI